MNTIVIIQARMGSTRLPGKVLLPLGGTVVLNYVVSRCKMIEGISEVIVATSNLHQDQAIVDWCHDNGITYFCGSEDDVLGRYYQCAKQYSTDYVMRVTADCPFLDYDLASKMVRSISEKTDVVQLSKAIPRGMPAELISFDTLAYINKYGQEPYHREHVTFYAYENKHIFNFTYVEVEDSKAHPELRITIDTHEDYRLCSKIATYFIGNIEISAAEVIRFLHLNPEITKINSHVQQKPVK